MTWIRQTKVPSRLKGFSVRTSLDCAAAFQKIAFDCVARVKAGHGGVLAGNPEAVHQMRVALTRLRAAVSFFAPMTADAKWRHLKKEIAWLNASLGAARDSDVLVAYARRRRFRAWAQRRTDQGLDKCQARDHRRLVRRLDSQRFQSLMEAMTDWIKRGPWLRRWERNSLGKPAKPLKAYSERELNRWRQRLIRKGRRLESLGASRRHRLRIRTKRLRYMLEALTDIVPLHDRNEFRQLRRATKRLQQVLGDMRDLERFARLGASTKGGRPAKKLPNYRQHRKKLLRVAAEALRSLKDAERV